MTRSLAPLTFAVAAFAGCDFDPKSVVDMVTPKHHSDHAVTVTSAGAVQLAPNIGTPVDAVHVKVAIDHVPVAGDTSAAELDIAGRPPLHPIAVRGQLATLPIINLGARDTTELELFFPATGVDPTAATLVWRVTTGGTPLEIRDVLGPPLTLTESSARHWWFSAIHPWPTFRHEDGVVTPLPPSSATVTEMKVLDREPATVECNDW
jgi:hypothetical protein